MVDDDWVVRKAAWREVASRDDHHCTTLLTNVPCMDIGRTPVD